MYPGVLSKIKFNYEVTPRINRKIKNSISVKIGIRTVWENGVAGLKGQSPMVVIAEKNWFQLLLVFLFLCSTFRSQEEVYLLVSPISHAQPWLV